MSRGKHFLNRESQQDSLEKFEKIRKEKRSEKGRTFDDWILNTENKKTKKIFEKKLEELLLQGCRFGRVIEVQKKNIFIAEESKKGEPLTEKLWLCTIAKRHFQRAHLERNFVVVGDRILFTPDRKLEFDENLDPLNTDLPHGVIEHSLPRKNKLSRKDPLRKEWEHILLVNIDLIAIVASVLNPQVRWGLIDRFLVQAELENIPAIIILNKSDLLEKEKKEDTVFYQQYQKRVSIYENIGYKIFEISALHPKKNKEKIQELRKFLKGKLIGFAGHSGVGKSSLVNLMKPEFEQIVDDNPEIFYKGRHTTTYNSLISLGIGAYAIDTPGIRSFDISVPHAIELSHCFPEFRKYSCQFRECAHHLEIQCEIKKAVEKGEISTERYRSYLGILTGDSFREGEVTGHEDALMIADLKAREFGKEEIE